MNLPFNNRKRDKSANCVKMRLIVHLENQYSSGVQNESGERCGLELLAALSICSCTSIKLVHLNNIFRNDAVKEVKFLQLDCQASVAV
jgi:hypothetical protein